MAGISNIARFEMRETFSAKLIEAARYRGDAAADRGRRNRATSRRVLLDPVRL